MNRRRFLTACASLLPLPAFVRASSLWLPPERPQIIVPEPFEYRINTGDGFLLLRGTWAQWAVANLVEKDRNADRIRLD